MGEIQDYVDSLLEQKENLSTEWDIDDAVELCPGEIVYGCEYEWVIAEDEDDEVLMM
ncbi:MAG: hypothetical protein AAF434_01230 [Pseudomonadota bacterium]